MSLKNIPIPGFRNIKTAISIFICLTVYNFIDRDGVILAIIAALICMQDSVEKSISQGKDRLIGTIIGGLFGVIFIYFGMLKLDIYLYFLISVLGVVLLIYICTILKIPNSVVIACVVFLIIVLGDESECVEDYLMYAVRRTVDTVFGIIVAVSVNRILYKPRPEKIKNKRREKILDINYDIIKSCEYKISKWNGGLDREIYTYPKNIFLINRKFSFRISVLEILKNTSIFTSYKNYRRHLISIDSQIKIEHENFHIVNLNKFTQDFFDAEWYTKTFGIGRCLNLIYKRGYYGIVDIVKDKDYLNLNSRKITAFFVVENDLTILISDNRGKSIEENLNYEDFIIIKDNNNNRDYTLNFRLNADDSFNKIVAIKIEVWK